MKRKLVLILFCVLLFGMQNILLMAGTLEYKPASPQIPTDSVQVEYSGKKLDNADLFLIVYTFIRDEHKPIASQFLLKTGKNGKLQAAFKPAAEAVYLLMKVTDGQSFTDNNEGAFWEIFPVGKDGKALQGSYIRAALSLVDAMPPNCARRPDPSKALAFLAKEPDNGKGNFQRTFITNTCRYMLKQISADSLRALSTALIKRFGPMVENEPETRTLAQALRMSGMQTAADSLEAQFAELHPISEFAEDAAANKVFMSKTKEDFLKNAEPFIQKYGYSAAIDRIAQTYVKLNIADGKIHIMAQKFLRDPALPASACIELSDAYLQKDSLKEALRWAERAVMYASDEASIIQPRFMATSEFKNQRMINYAEALLTNGFVAKKMKSFDKALALYTKVLNECSPVLPAEQAAITYESITELEDAASNHRQAYAMASKAISLGYSTPKILGDHKKLFDFLYAESKPPAPYEQVLADLQKSGATAKRSRMLLQKMNQQPLHGTLSTMDGTKINTRDWKGKVIFVDFWATWCGPCKRSFPAVQKLYDKYKDNPRVQFAIINCWERTEDRKATVKEFLSKNPYTFPIFFDETDDLVRSYGVTGIPSKFYLDKNGGAQFKEVGLEPEEKFLEEASARIEALLEE
jgi:thiol-disulfide isomerase/thioredoxin